MGRRNKGQRRARSPHPGVVLRKPRKRKTCVTHYARCLDPDTGEDVDVNLTKLGKTTKWQRDDWAKKRSKAIQQRLAELAEGAPRHTNTPIDVAIQKYFDSARKGATTVEIYRRTTDIFEDWCVAQKLKTGDEIFPAHLGQFVEHLKTLPKLCPAKGGEPGERVASEERLAVASVNSAIRSVRAVLNVIRRAGRLPHLSKADIEDCFREEQEDKPRKRFLKQKPLRALLEATLRHDRECFKATRHEHASRATKGSTHRYDPITPFVCFVVLSGCRLSEARTMRWEEIDLEDLEITVLSTSTKTRRERLIDLEVSPLLVRLLRTLKFQAGSSPFVFGGSSPWSRSKVDSAKTRLVEKFGAPDFRWQDLRQTCATFLTNAPGIFGGASHWRSAQQLGHSVQVAEKHYVGLHKNISPEAKTLDDAMEIADLLKEIVEDSSVARLRRRRSA